MVDGGWWMVDGGRWTVFLRAIFATTIGTTSWPVAALPAFTSLAYMIDGLIDWLIVSFVSLIDWLITATCLHAVDYSPTDQIRTELITCSDKKLTTTNQHGQMNKNNKKKEKKRKEKQTIAKKSPWLIASIVVIDWSIYRSISIISGISLIQNSAIFMSLEHFYLRNRFSLFHWR